MSSPEDAVERARGRAAQRRAEGGYREDPRGFAVEPTARVGLEDLMEWAHIEPDPDEVYSTRRLGAPVTAVKRGLLRALWQYHRQILDQQNRFNMQLVTYVSELEDRISELERRDDRPPAP